jgi:hypothetical protein
MKQIIARQDSIATFNDVTVDGPCEGSHVITRTWSLVDNCGNAALNQIQTITVSDNTAPTFTRPADITIFTDANCNYNASTAVTGDVTNEADNCLTGINATFSDITVAGPCEGSHVITRTWSLVDNCGNAALNQIQTITVSDNTAPTFTRPADITIFTDANCNYNASTAVTGDVTNEADNCSTGINATFSDVTVDGPCEGSHVITRTWSLVDNCGNAALNQIQTITVSDNTAPTFTRPADITIFTDANCNYNAGVGVTGDVTNEADNCSTGINAAFSDVTVDGPCEGSHVITRTWSLVDNCGNAALNQIQTITVSDNTVPTFTRPADITIFTDANCNYNAGVGVTGDVSNEADNCSTGINATFSDVIVDGPCEGSHVITRTWSLVDNCGNAALDQIQTITVSDNTPPTFTRPADITIFTDANCNYNASTAVTGDVTNEADNCSTGINATFSDVTADGPCEGSHVITRTWSLVDNCGNAALDQIQTITVSDNTPPTFTRPADITIFTDANCNYNASIAVTGDVNNEADNCSTGLNATFSDVTVDGPCEGSHVITRTWSLVDNCGNAALDQIQIITVNDNTPPTLITLFGAMDATLDCNNTVGIATALSQAPFAVDNCDPSPGIQLISDLTVQGSCPNAYTRTRQWNFTDDCGNTSPTFTQILTVQDTTRPAITCPGDITITYPASTDPSNTGSATAADLCDGAPIVIYLDSIPGQYCPVTNFIKRKWIAIDACGNQNTCVQWITIIDQGTICGAVHDDLGQAMAGVQVQLFADMNANQVVDAGDTLVTTTTTSGPSGSYCFTNIRPCNYVVVEIQPATYGSLSDYDTSPDPDGDDSSDGPDNQIPVTLSQGENDINNDFVDIICPTIIPTLPYDTICSGQSVVLQINSMSLGALTYSWNFGSGSTPGTGTGLGPHTVSYVTTTQNQASGASVVLTVSKTGCSNLAGQVTLIDVNPYPNAAINSSTADICYYTDKIFQPVAPIIPGASYTWNFGSGAVPATATGYGPHTVYYTTASAIPKTVKLVIKPNEAGAQCPDSSTISFIVTSCPGSVAGFTLSNFLVGINGVTVKLYEDNNPPDGNPDAFVRQVTTSNGGQYVMANITPGNYVLQETQPANWLNYDDYDASNDGDVVPNSSGLDNLIPVTILPNEVDTMNNFIEVATPGNITGNVFADANNNLTPDNGEGLGSVSLRLLSDNNADGKADNNTPVATQTSNPNGNYTFNSIPVGNYVVVEINPVNYMSVMDYDASNDNDVVANTNTTNDTIPVTLTNNEIDANNYFIDQVSCPKLVTTTADGGYGSLRYNIDCAQPGDTIRFGPGLTGSTITLTSVDIELDKNLVFISTLSPTVTISSSVTGLFVVLNNVTAEFRDMNFHQWKCTWQHGSLLLITWALLNCIM